MTLNLSIRQRLVLLALLALAGVAFVSSLFYSSNRVNQAALAEVFEVDGQTLVRLQKIENLLLEVRFRAAGVLLEQLPVQGSLNHLKQVRKDIDMLHGEFEPVALIIFSDGDGKEAMQLVKGQWALVGNTLDALEKGYVSKDNKAIATVLEDQWPVLVKGIVKPLQTLIPLAQQRSQETYSNALVAAQNRLMTGLLGGLASLILIGLVAAMSIRSILGGLSAVKVSLQQIAGGDLASPLPAKTDDELGSMVETLYAMQDSLSDLVREVRQSANSIELASSEVASGNADLSDRTERAASSLQATASNTDQLATSVEGSASSAQEASKLAESAAVVAEKGGHAVNAVMQTMDSISNSSRKISDIIGVIDGIAFQTNILALNAAVEAARAGEQGRGFAVVASEVRSLAGRSAEAAREIKQLISASGSEVQAGAAQVQNASSTMTEIVTAVQQVSGRIQEVSTAASRQAGGIHEINEAVTQLESVTQQNAALVEESSAAAHSLQDQARALTHLVGRFRILGQERGTSEVVSPARVALSGSGNTPAASSRGEINLDNAIKAHAEWRTKLRAAASAHQQMDAATISRDDCCELGKWLHGPAQMAHGGHAGFVSLIQAHKSFHESAGKIARAINAGAAVQDVESMMASGSGFSEATNNVTRLIVEMKRGSAPRPAASLVPNAGKGQKAPTTLATPKQVSTSGDADEWETF